MIGKPFQITPSLAARVRALQEYGLSLRAIATRLSIAESTAHKIVHSFPLRVLPSRPLRSGKL